MYSWNDQAIVQILTFLMSFFLVLFSLYYTSRGFNELIKKTRITFKLYVIYNYKVYLAVGLLIFVTIINYLFGEKYFLALVVYSFVVSVLLILRYRERQQVNDVVSCNMGKHEDENGKNGLLCVAWEDGKTEKDILGEHTVLKTNYNKKQGYIYFAFDERIVDRFRYGAQRNVYILVEYYDNSKYGSSVIHYDSIDIDIVNPHFKRAENEISFKGENRWKIATVAINDGNFRRTQQGCADFRIRAGRASSEVTETGRTEYFDIMIRKVIVVAAN